MEQRVAILEAKLGVPSQVSAPAQANIQSVEIYNIVGKRVKKFLVENGSRDMQFFVNDLEEGIYFLESLAASPVNAGTVSRLISS